MDVSIIKEMPKGRLPVKTKVFNNKQMKEILIMFEFSLIYFKTEDILKLKELIEKELMKRGA